MCRQALSARLQSSKDPVMVIVVVGEHHAVLDEVAIPFHK